MKGTNLVFLEGEEGVLLIILWIVVEVIVTAFVRYLVRLPGYNER
jgi:hypothetical protein